MIQAIVAGFAIGLFSSFHCVGMCGPIALALPVANAGKWKRLWFILLYNFGRMLTYAALGLIFGFFGKHLFIGRYQQWLSIFIGISILFFFFFSSSVNFKIPIFTTYKNTIKRYLSQVFKGEKKFYTFLLIGLFNGLLPCGLVYIALAGAVATGSPTKSTAFMAAFGFGTFPIMFVLTVLGKYISLQWRNQMQKAIPIFVSIMALLLILRGLNLGIPYISPEIDAATGTATCCHK